MKRIKIFDTTLRDGEQSPGCSMNLTEKIEMARQLEKLGVDVIEAGFAIASPMDHKSVQAISAAVTNCTVASLARCAKGDSDAAWDAVKEANHPRIHVFLATSDIHMEYKLKMTREQVIDRIREMLDGDEPSIVATGPNAPVIARYCRNHVAYDKYLLMEGLRIIYEKNVDNGKRDTH